MAKYTFLRVFSIAICDEPLDTTGHCLKENKINYKIGDTIEGNSDGGPFITTVVTTGEGIKTYNVPKEFLKEVIVDPNAPVVPKSSVTTWWNSLAGGVKFGMVVIIIIIILVVLRSFKVF